MNVMFVVSNPAAKSVLLALLSACRRKGVASEVFITNDGVKILAETAVIQALTCCKRAVVCEHSWGRFMGHEDCPIELGSQTQNSMMVGETSRIISL